MITIYVLFGEDAIKAWDDALNHHIVKGGPVNGYTFFTYSDDWFQHATGDNYPWNSSVAEHTVSSCASGTVIR